MARDESLQRAIKLSGGLAGLASKIGITFQAVSQWRRCPVRRVLQVEAATGGAVTREQLRPDFYPPKVRSKAA